jgi:ABC-type nitrate/sulfonate/bicarbonate transport system permease component
MQGKRFVNKLSGITLIVVLLLCWELSVRTGAVQSVSFPPVSAIFIAWGKLIASGRLAFELGSSLGRMAAGYAIGAVLGIVIGMAMGYFRSIDRLLEPLVELLRPIPAPAYIPLAILLLGLGASMKIFLIAAAALFPILLNTHSGVRQVDPVQVDTGRTFGLKPWELMRKIILPASLPQIFTGLRVSLGIGLIMVVISEMVAANSGIGYFILQAQRTFEVAQMYAGIFTLGVVGYVLNALFLQIEKRVVHWR